MKITVQLTEADLAEMGATKEQIKQAIVQLLDGGIQIDDDRKVYLAGFNVYVNVVSDIVQRGGFEIRPDSDDL